MYPDLFPTIFTPQGDGNLAKRKAIAKLNINCIPDNIYPARGRKLPRTPALEQGIRSRQNSRQYLPRKGTETTFLRSCRHRTHPNSRQYLPRKGTETAFQAIWLNNFVA